MQSAAGAELAVCVGPARPGAFLRASPDAARSELAVSDVEAGNRRAQGGAAAARKQQHRSAVGARACRSGRIEEGAGCRCGERAARDPSAVGSEVEFTAAGHVDGSRAEVEHRIGGNVEDAGHVARVGVARADVVGCGGGCSRRGRARSKGDGDCRQRARSQRCGSSTRSHLTAPARPATSPPALPEAWIPLTS